MRCALRAGRSSEKAGADGFMLLSGNPILDIPRDDMSDPLLQAWIKTHSGKGVHMIPIDAKMYSVTPCRKLDHRRSCYYAWTNNWVAQEFCDVCFVLVEGLILAASYYSVASVFAQLDRGSNSVAGH
ncbi:uncharacterized protein MYCGRDRAFT_97987 [Zymoseptoria tritici IPO323]|uniref:Uncharacterized protein n=1 Tax=Zymoseptoria tritici (strain CBS 115943 / IPO323) TaxID=336722 RepID=F9XRZ7_ZYMTI|nr:uncharacterized protein MYCGRDRAFT_97987 [Zymoseptoria tritici IPO323]EGP82016.1 hypothetical protein MYCGRDRAFT_97987 [Zymoseptoria tritici IPO323]